MNLSLIAPNIIPPTVGRPPALLSSTQHIFHFGGHPYNQFSILDRFRYSSLRKDIFSFFEKKAPGGTLTRQTKVVDAKELYIYIHMYIHIYIYNYTLLVSFLFLEKQSPGDSHAKQRL